MKKETKRTVYVIAVVLALILLATLDRKGLLGNNTVQASRWDGSVSVVKRFMGQYLRDPRSYESVSWGTLLNNNDGTYSVSHAFRAKNALGITMEETMRFTVSADGNQVLSYEDGDGYHETAPDAIDNYRTEYYRKSNFWGKSFKGVLTKYVDGVNEQYTFTGTLSKDGDDIAGTLSSVENNVTYNMKGSVSTDGILSLTIQNVQDKSVQVLNGHVEYDKITANFYDPQTHEALFNFYLNQID